MNAETMERFRDLLLEERKRAAEVVGRFREENSRSIEDETDEETFDNHLADAATITLDREITNSLEESEEQKLQAIDGALERIGAGTYGTCARCGRPISEERLEAMPWADKCIDCKRLEERG